MLLKNPKPIPLGNAPGAALVVRAARTYTCGIFDVSSNKDVYCWGKNDRGIFGVDPASKASSVTPVMVGNLPSAKLPRA